MENLGWIKLHRQLQNKAFYNKDSEKVHLWIHLLIKANHEEREEMFGGKPYRCKAGEFTTGRKQLASETGICESKIERILTNFEKIEQQIEQQKSSVNRLISIRNWGLYQQSEQQNEQQVNSDRTTSEQRVNTLQEAKNIRSKEIKNKSLMFDFLQKSNDSLSEIEKITFEFWKLFKSNLEILKIEPTTLMKAKMGEWSNQTRLMIENKECTIEELREIFVFLKNSDFWRKNIVSMQKLRKQREKLLIESRSQNTKAKQGNLFAVNPDIRNNPDRLKFRK